MSVEAKDVKSLEVLEDVKFLADAVQTIRFYTSPDSWIRGYMPQIDTWSQGQMSVLIKPENVNKVAAILKTYAITPKNDYNISSGYSHEIKFDAKATDPIISVLSAAMERQKLMFRSEQLKTIHTHIKNVAADLPNVHSSLFSRGVKNFKENVRSLEQRCKDQQQGKVM